MEELAENIAAAKEAGLSLEEWKAGETARLEQEEEKTEEEESAAVEHSKTEEEKVDADEDADRHSEADVEQKKYEDECEQQAGGLAKRTKTTSSSNM